MKKQRQRALLELVRREPLGSQEDIRRRLERLGHPATQSTISRDLEELGLVRVRDGDGHLRYGEAMNGGGQPAVSLRELLGEFASGVEVAGNLLLVKTQPGAANAVAEGLDRSGLDGVLGTVAGDDTILVVMTNDGACRRIATQLQELAGLS
jgi:transcriptional regulator of arginine metabolism